MLETDNPEIKGFQKEDSYTLHIENPLMGTSLCGRVNGKSDSIKEYRLDIAIPPYGEACNACMGATQKMSELPAKYVQRIMEIVSELRRRESGMGSQAQSIPDETRSRVQELITEVLGEDQQPGFYAVGGSHLYGFADEDSDIDVRGFHVNPAEQYSLLDDPDKQIKINQDGLTDGYDRYENIDFVSYELKHFGKLLSGCNPNLLETCFGGFIIQNNYQQQISDLKRMVEKNVPLCIPRHYEGWASSIWEARLENPDLDSYNPAAKNYLYVIRLVLAAMFLMDRGLVEPRLRVLSEYYLDGSTLVDDLIQEKRNDEEHLNAQMEDVCYELTEDLFDTLEVSEVWDPDIWQDEVDKWMVSVREE